MFLHRIANAFYTEYQQDISNFMFVFPNRRAGLFFQKYLTQIIEKPIFSPEITTVNEVFYHSSQLQIADRTDLIFRLYRIFKQISKRDENFDVFAGWGEMLLGDFDDVDKYLIEPTQIFRNISELKEIELQFNPFSEKQIEALQQFWVHFSPVKEGTTQQDYIAIWKILLPIYKQFREELLAENLATDAMIFREIAKKLKDNITIPFLENKQFVFVGFNALNPCEKALFEALKKNNQADFYWDYEGDELNDKDNPASFYVENIRNFPSKLKIDSRIISLKDKDFTLIAIPSAVGQTKETYHLLNQLYPTENQNNDWIKTAVVLADENLLLPLLSSIPQQIDNVNVTMGFPMKSTPVSGLMEHFFDLQKRMRKSDQNTSFYHQTVQSILNHSYIQLICENDARKIAEKIIAENRIFVDQDVFEFNPLLHKIFSPCNEVKKFIDYLIDNLKNIYQFIQNQSTENSKNQLDEEFLYQYYTSLNRLGEVIKKSSENIEMSLDTIIRIIKHTTHGLTIPFEGEPLEGLQIMGALETRGLDFENLIICSFNEGVFPKRTVSTSFIPYNLRKGFELPTSENQDAISAYNFYRLIQRCNRVFFLYDVRTEGSQSGELSRFAHQLQYHYGVKFNIKNLTYNIHSPENKPIVIQKTADVLQKLETFTLDVENAPAFSASSLNNYVDCPLKFYLSQLEKVYEPDEVLENIEANMFGTLLHQVMQDMYEPYEERLVNTSDLDELHKNQFLIDKLIRNAFAKKYFKKDKKEVKLEGNYLLTGKIIEKYVKQILIFDKKQAPFKYIKSEKKCVGKISIQHGKFNINLKGIIDRIDEKEGVVRIIDYKTGKGSLEFNNLEEVFQHENDKRPKHILQILLYSLLYKKETNHQIIEPNIYYLQEIFKENFSTPIIEKQDKAKLKVENFTDYQQEFEERLIDLLEEIFNPQIPFSQCINTLPCEYCSFNVICRR